MISEVVTPSPALLRLPEHRPDSMLGWYSWPPWNSLAPPQTSPRSTRCLLLQALVRIIKPPVQDLMEFLQQHIQRDLEQLTRTLGKGADETTHVVHLILCRLLRQQHHPGHSKGTGCGARPQGWQACCSSQWETKGW